MITSFAHHFFTTFRTISFPARNALFMVNFGVTVHTNAKPVKFLVAHWFNFLKVCDLQ